MKMIYEFRRHFPIYTMKLYIDFDCNSNVIVLHCVLTNLIKSNEVHGDSSIEAPVQTIIDECVLLRCNRKITVKTLCTSLAYIFSRSFFFKSVAIILILFICT